MARHNIFIYDLDGIAWEILPKSWEFEDELNHESTASFTVSFQDFKKIATATNATVLGIFSGAFREVVIERNGTKVFWGFLSDLTIEPTTDGEMNVKLKASSWFGLFSKRIAGVPKRVFTSVDAGEIAWTLIDESQSADSPYSDIGITEGTITASKNRDRTYKFDKIKDQIINLSNANLEDGFDFEIDNTKNFNVYYPTKGNDRFNVVFDTRSLSSFRFHKPLVLGLTNIVHAVGDGENDEVIYETRTASSSFRGDWYTLEEKSPQVGITEATTLQDKGDKILSLRQTPVVEFSVQHYDTFITWDDYQIGDSIKVNLPELGLSQETKRVMRRKFTMDSSKSIGVISSELL